ncbi:MAG: hypothetical protein LBC25_02315, partial [Holosporales bacterium]|nr:hypothetical protein [Holosporales bacterium]
MQWGTKLRCEIAMLFGLEASLSGSDFYDIYTGETLKREKLPPSSEKDQDSRESLKIKLRKRIAELGSAEAVLLDPISAELAEKIMASRKSEIEKHDKLSWRQKFFLKKGGQYALNVGPIAETLNEKVLWTTLCYYGFSEQDSSEVTSWIWNKLTAKLFVRDTVGAKYVARLYGAFKNLKEIFEPEFWDRLPQKFVVKIVLGCFGMFVRVVDKNDPKSVESTSSLKAEKFPRITEERYIVEEYLPPLIPDCTVTDYKFVCSYGNIIFVVVGYAPARPGPISSNDKWEDIYTVPNWHLLDATYCSLKQIPIEKPSKLAEMMEVAQKLSRSSPLIRIDLYLTKDEEGQFVVKVGEITTRIAGGTAVIKPVGCEYLAGELVPTMSEADFDLLKDRDLIEVHEWMEKLKQSTDLMHDTMMPGFNCTPHINWDSLSPWAEKRLQGSSIKEIKDSRCQEINKLPPLL